MLPDIAYQKFIVKINKNAQTNNISCDKGRFVLIYNENQNKLIESILEKRGEDDIRYLQKILVPEHKISSSDFSIPYQLFPLPKDFFDHSTAYGMAVCDKCETDQRIDLVEIKSENENFVLQDENHRPSFEWREAPYYLTSDSVKVFKDNFTYSRLLLTYYRYPKQISLKDPDNPEGQFSSTEIEFDDKFVDRVISLAAADFEINNENPKYQLDTQRAKLK